MQKLNSSDTSIKTVFSNKESIDIIKAECLFTKFLVEHNAPLPAADHAGSLFRFMFPDLSIALNDLYARMKATETQVAKTTPQVNFCGVVKTVQLAIKNIASNIGSKWRVLASELDIPEHHIDDIRRKYPQDFSTQALKVLEIWFQYNNGNATLEALETALEARLCRMKGLGLHLLRPAVKVE